MEKEINKDKIKKDLLIWAAKLRKADQEIRDVYAKLNQIYAEVLDD